jgi:hypothetical protein
VLQNSSKGKHKKKHRKDESSDIFVEDKLLDKKKSRKDESSDIHVEDKKVKKHYFEDNHQVELVYYDPAIIQEVDVFQDLAQNSLVSYQNDDDVEAVDHVVEALDQNFDDSGQVDEALGQDGQVTEEFEDINWDGKDK